MYFKWLWNFDDICNRSGGRGLISLTPSNRSYVTVFRWLGPYRYTGPLLWAEPIYSLSSLPTSGTRHWLCLFRRPQRFVVSILLLVFLFDAILYYFLIYLKYTHFLHDTISILLISSQYKISSPKHGTQYEASLLTVSYTHLDVYKRQMMVMITFTCYSHSRR